MEERELSLQTSIIFCMHSPPHWFWRTSAPTLDDVLYAQDSHHCKQLSRSSSASRIVTEIAPWSYFYFFQRFVITSRGRLGNVRWYFYRCVDLLSVFLFLYGLLSISNLYICLECDKYVIGGNKMYTPDCTLQMFLCMHFIFEGNDIFQLVCDGHQNHQRWFEKHFDWKVEGRPDWGTTLETFFNGTRWILPRRNSSSPVFH